MARGYRIMRTDLDRELVEHTRQITSRIGWILKDRGLTRESVFENRLPHRPRDGDRKCTELRQLRRV